MVKGLYNIYNMNSTAQMTDNTSKNQFQTKRK